MLHEEPSTAGATQIPPMHAAPATHIRGLSSKPHGWPGFVSTTGVQTLATHTRPCAVSQVSSPEDIDVGHAAPAPPRLRHVEVHVVPTQSSWHMSPVAQ
jgi:hypothetical protein